MLGNAALRAIPGWRPVGLPADLVASVGEHTKAGQNGIAVTGTAIVSGDPAGHWQIAGGLLSPSASGDAADLSAGPYEMILDSGQTVSVSVTAGERHVATLAEIQTLLDGTHPREAGETRIRVQPGSYDIDSLTTSAQPTGVTWMAADLAQPPIFNRWVLDHVAEPGTLGFEHVIFDMPYPSAPAPFWSPLPSTMYAICHGGADRSEFTGTSFRYCEFRGNLPAWAAGGRMTVNNPAVRIQNGMNFTFEHNVVTGCRAGLELSGVENATIRHNDISGFHADPFVVSNYNAPVTGVLIAANHIHGPAGDTSYHHIDTIQLQPTRPAGDTGWWEPDTAYVIDAVASDGSGDGSYWRCLVDHTSGTGTFAQDRAAHPTYWTEVTDVHWVDGLEVVGNTVTLYHAPIVAQVDPSDTQTTEEYAPYTTGAPIPVSMHGRETRVEPPGAEVYPIPPASTGRMRLNVRMTGGAGTATISLDGDDTWMGGATGPTLAAAGEWVTMVSDGVSDWTPAPQGGRAWFQHRSTDFDFGPFEAGLVTKMDGSAGPVTGTLLGDAGPYHVQCEISDHTCRVVAASGTLTHHGAPVAEIVLPVGYGLTLTGDGAGNWTAEERLPTGTFFFANRGPYRNIKVHGNIAAVWGDFVRIECEVPGLQVFNNTAVSILPDDMNADGVIGRYEGNTGQDSPIYLSGVTAFSQRNFTVGGLYLTSYGAAATDLGSIALGITDTATVPASLVAHLAATTRAAYQPRTRAECIAAAQPKPGGPLDGTLIGAVPYYDFTLDAVNTAVLPAPVLASSSPAHGADPVGVDTPIVLTFDQFVMLGAGTITLRNVTDSVDIETFDVDLGTGSSGGTVAASQNTVTITPGASMPGPATVSVRAAAGAITSRLYGTDWPGIADDVTLAFETDAAAPSSFETVAAAGGYLTGTLAAPAGPQTRILIAVRLYRDPTSDTFGNILSMDAAKDIGLQAMATGELRVTLGNSLASSFRIPNAVPTAPPVETILVSVDLSAASHLDGVQVYRGGTAIAPAALTGVNWDPSAYVEQSPGASPWRVLNYTGDGQVFRGDVDFVSVSFPGTLPDLSDAAVRAWWEPAQILTAPPPPALLCMGPAADFHRNRADDSTLTVVDGPFTDV
ncbi:Ig-like domain-containing protein [Roseospira navarrensis]|uniref:SbsA Ig-like domain-containing protein n=1 Tax=Roseospira navarrensis TaxID=140058 RepID=A0A7X1ZE02_9PROT|nr:Ig-like domain-containing protein [Roseospira navarrensis]MQX36809.1 hypothetical protein [Roseospira navarrensis]